MRRIGKYVGRFGILTGIALASWWQAQRGGVHEQRSIDLDQPGGGLATTLDDRRVAVAGQCHVAATFSAGAVALLDVMPLAPMSFVPAVAAVSLVCLTILGMVGARVCGGTVGPSVARVIFWPHSPSRSLRELADCSEPLWDRSG